MLSILHTFASSDLSEKGWKKPEQKVKKKNSEMMLTFHFNHLHLTNKHKKIPHGLVVTSSGRNRWKCRVGKCLKTCSEQFPIVIGQLQLTEAFRTLSRNCTRSVPYFGTNKKAITSLVFSHG